MKASIPKEAVAALVRDSSGRILLAKRNPKLRFMGGAHAFPGGAIDTSDHHLADLVTGVSELALSPLQSEKLAVDAVALSRELFEETGLLLAIGSNVHNEVLERAREGLLAGDHSFEEILLQHRLLIDASRIREVGEFVTPETTSKRFRARYYLLDRDDLLGDTQLIEGELVELNWWKAEAAIKAWANSEIDLAPPVAFTLQQFASKPTESAVRYVQDAKEYTAHNANAYETFPGIVVLPLLSPTLAPARHTNCIILGRHKRVIVDPAAVEPDEQRRLIDTLRFMMHPGDTIEAVVLTHSHKDHFGSAELISREFDAPIWAHEQTAATLDFSVERKLSDGETIKLPGDPELLFHCMYTPGHHPGHLCLWEEGSRSVIAGDMVSALSTVVIPHGHGGNMTHYIESLQRLIDLNPSVLIPAHGFVIREPNRYLKVQLDHRFVREKQIKDAVDAGIRGIDDLLTACYAIPRELRRAASLTLKAHLVRLGVTDFEE